MKQKAIAVSLALVLGAGLSCDAPVRPATTGSINVILLSAANGLRLAANAPGATDLERAPDGSRQSVTLTSARVTVTGPTTRTVTNSTPSGGFFDLTVDQLSPGTYTVTVEGLLGSEVNYFGQTSSVTVTVGATTDATVTFATFQPTIPLSTVVDTTDVLRFTVSFTGVAGATGYIVAWSKNADMSGASTKSITGTSTDIAVPDEGKYYVTVRAVNSVVTAGGVASLAKAVYAFQGVATVTVTPAGPSLVAGATQQFAAEARDADNNVVANVTWLWVSSNPNVAIVNQTGLATAIANGVTTITAVGKGMPGSTAINVSSAPPVKLVFSIQPANATAGQSMPAVQVAVQDVNGKIVTSDNATQVTVAIGTNAGGGTLTGTATATVTAGVANFSNLSINKSGSGYTLSAAASGLTAGTSGQFNVNAGAATKLAFSIQPASSIAGDPLSPAVQVEIRDANDNVVTSSRDAVTIAFANNAGAGTLTGTKVVNAINGIASFSGLWINKIGVGYTLSASATGVTGATSTGFTITPAAPAKLAFSQQPTAVQGAVAIAPPVTVTIADQFDNPVNTATNSITVSLGTNPWKTPFAAGASLAGTRTVAAVAGVATFSNLRIDKPAPGYALAANAGSLAGANSANFNVNLTIQQVSASTAGSHTCAIAMVGTYCWGYNGNGQLGIPPTSQFQDSIAVLVNTNQTFTSVTTGANFSCGLTAAKAAFCWGNNNQGQLGTGNTTSSDVPVAVTGGHLFEQIDAGYLHACGVTTSNGLNNAEDRQVYCWGYNPFGQVGDGTTGTDRPTPLQVVNGAGLRTDEATQIATGQYHTCARAANGNAYCWGYNYYGQLGDATVLDVNGGNGVNQPAPRLVSGGTLWNSVAAGGFHSCGIASNPGTPARCWGLNNSGQLGNTATTNSSTSVAVTGGFAWASISGGSSHTCGVLTDGKGYCFGNNSNGELGDDNQPTDATQPVQVSGSSLIFDKIDAGANHSCGRTTTSLVYCWGYNGSGQLGSPGTGAIKKVPTQIVQ